MRHGRIPHQHFPKFPEDPLFLWLFSRVFARFRALSFPLSSDLIGRESAGNKSRKQTRENSRMLLGAKVLGLIRGHPRHPR
jgi:hypothetical protein